MTQHRTLRSILFTGVLLALFTGDAQGDSPKKLGPNPIKCPAKFVCKMPSRGVDFPVCHAGDIPPTCDKQSDCVKLGLGNKTCTRVAPFFSLCVQACTP